MSQNRHKPPKFKATLDIGWSFSFERVFYTLLLICFAGIFILAANSAQAATTRTKLGKNPTYVLKTNLEDMAKRDTAILDWRTQEFELTFDLPAHDWYESLDLFLSAYPEGQVARGTPLLISYNGAKPVPLYGRGSRFDAHISMDTSRIRLSGNSIKISYQTPRDTDCLTPGNGQWILDLSKSKLVANVRAKKRNMQIMEIEQRLSHAMTAPKRVSIVAKGNNKLSYEALAAQAIAGRMDFVPEFKLNSGPSDMQVLIGSHNDIRPLLNNKSVLSTKGAKVFIDSGRLPKIVLSAETEEQVLELARAFATYQLPKARRTSISLHEFYSGTKLMPRTIVTTGNYKLSDIAPPILLPSWRPEPARIDFNVADPHTASGVLILKILSAKDINPKSRLDVKLNNKSIGYTHLNKPSKTVEFRIKLGMFSPSKNKISIEPAIQPSASATLCQNQQYIPTLLVSNASKFRLSSGRPTPATELSRLAASGAPFVKDSALVLTARNIRDKQASLRFLGYAAQQFGPKWTNATYLSALPVRDNLNKNILIIGPNPIKDPTLFSAAPSGLKTALGTKGFQSPNGKAFTATDRFASAKSGQIFHMAARQNQSTRLKSGGLAALFPSPYANDRMVGVISSDRPGKFASAMDMVVTNEYWNDLQGSVTRWDKSEILMVQTATPLPASFNLPKPESFSNTPKFVSAAQNWFASLNKNKPKKSFVDQVEPTQTASNDPQIGVAHVIEPVALRGPLPTKASAHIATAKKKRWNLSLSKLSKPAVSKPTVSKPTISKPISTKSSMPFMTKLKLKSYQTSRDLKSWWKKSSRSAFAATPLRKWWKDITHNQTAFFVLIVFLGFFVTALASPMSIRRKK